MYTLPAYVGIILEKDNQVLLVKRCNTDWACKQWNFPGGLLEEHETLVNAAVREAAEEIGVTIEPTSLELVHVLHVRASAINTKDILGFYFRARIWQGTPINKELHRHSEIGWLAINQLPANSTAHALQALKGIQMGIHYSEN